MSTHTYGTYEIACGSFKNETHTLSVAHTPSGKNNNLKAGAAFNPAVMDLPPAERPITGAINANGSANHNNSIVV